MPAPFPVNCEEDLMIGKIFKTSSVICGCIILSLILGSCSSTDEEDPNYFLSKEHVQKIVSVITGVLMTSDDARRELKDAIDRGKNNEDNEPDTEDSDDVDDTLFPKDPVMFEGNIDGVIMTVFINFQSSAIEGTLSYSGDDYARADVSGSIDKKTLGIEAKFTGVVGSTEHGIELPWDGTIEGTLSSDFEILVGTLVDDEGVAKKYSLTRIRE